jgi:hypothetical protein
MLVFKTTGAAALVVYNLSAEVVHDKGGCSG